MTSQLGALATLYFYEDIPAFFQLQERYEILRHRRPTFDARVWNVPNLMEAANTFVWREQDATRNSIQMAAGALFSHKELFEKDTKDMQEMMWQKGVNWNNYPDEFKRGTYILRKTVKRPFSVDEIEKLPPMHEARKNPDLVIERSEYQITRFPVPITKIEDRVGVLFKGLSV
jgi:tRNA(His) guanylyltransferase